MMYKSTDPTERFKGLTADQIQKLDMYLLRLKTGEVEDVTEYRKIKAENESLKKYIGQVNNGGLDVFNTELQKLNQKMKEGINT